MTHDAEAFRRTFLDSPVGMAILDADGRLDAVNPSLAALLGSTAEALLGRALADLTHPDDRPQHRQVVSRLAHGTHDRVQLQQRCVHATGDVLWTRATLSRLPGSPWRAVVHVEDLTEVRRAHALVEHHSYYDRLTGLANRTLLLERLRVSLEKAATSTACLFVDLDHFKVVNDSLGHEAGDRLLTEVARRIQAAVRPGDTVARLGGDEFVVALADVSEEGAAALLSQLVEAVRQPAVVADHEVVPTVSAGLAFGQPGVTAETLVRDADIAMSRAKTSGRDRIAVFSADLRDEAMVRLSIESEPARGTARGPPRGALPARGGHGHAPAHRVRGTGALAPPRARPPAPRRVHRGMRRSQPSDPAGRVRPPRGVPIHRRTARVHRQGARQRVDPADWPCGPLRRRHPRHRGPWHRPRSPRPGDHRVRHARRHPDGGGRSARAHRHGDRPALGRLRDGLQRVVQRAALPRVRPQVGARVHPAPGRQVDRRPHLHRRREPRRQPGDGRDHRGRGDGGAVPAGARPRMAACSGLPVRSPAARAPDPRRPRRHP
nr:sensor domain-containing diguanylate cyclase [Demequina litorisediminis]